MASNKSQGDASSQSIECPLKVRRSKSLVPPSVVELSRNSVLLSWRATLGQCSIRTDKPKDSVRSQGWGTLAEDDGRHRLRQKHGVKHSFEARSETSRVDVFEVDHVELQTCCGCPRCVYGREDDRQDEEEAFVEAGASVCRCCSHARRGLGCWRPVYQGPDSRCRVILVHGNTLHYFRILVRARVPPPDMRGFMRPQREQISGAATTTSRGFEQPDDSDMFGGRALPDRLSPNRRTRGRDQSCHPGVVTVSSSDQDEGTCSVGSPATTHGCPRAAAGDDDASLGSPSRGGGATSGSPTTLSDHPKGFGVGGDVAWFSSDPVFVDSRPPPVDIHGIGTALVLTWPALSGFSGEERVSYTLEKRSHACTPPTYSRRENNFPPDEGCLREPGGWPRSRQRHHRRLAPPTYADAKELFSVGTRCWFMPTGLQKATRYWYRLRFGHEGGRSVGGPWVSHTTSIAPPRCTRVERRALLLSLPRAINDDVCLGRGVSSGKHGIATSFEPLRTNSAAPLSASSVETGHFDSHQSEGRSELTGVAVEADGEGDDNDAAEAGEEKNDRSLECQEEQTETPMVWYTLQGLDRVARWVVLYRGPCSEVIVKGLQPNALVKFRVGIDVDITELRRRSLGPLASLELEPPTTVSTSPTDDAKSAAASSGWLSHNRTTSPGRGDYPSRSSVVRPALRLKAPAAARSAIQNNPTGQSSTGTHGGRLERRRLSSSPVPSPTVSQMKREGFRFHDLAATVGGGFYPERPLLSWGRLQGHRDGAVWECCPRGVGDRGSEPQCREVSATAEFSTACVPPRFAAFVVCGTPQVKLWWAKARSGAHHADAISSPRLRSATARPATAPPSTAPATATHRRNDRHPRSGFSDSSPSFGDRPFTAEEVARRIEVDMVASDDVGAPSSVQQNPFFRLEALVPPTADGGDTTTRSVYSGTGLWADLLGFRSPSLGSGADVLSTLAPSTAYCVRLSAKTGASQPESVAEGVVITAPPAPGINPAAAREPVAPLGTAAGAGEGVGMVTVKAVWRTDIDKSFLPAGVELPPWSIALEMAQACEAGPVTGGMGGTATTAAQPAPSERRPQQVDLSGASATPIAAADHGSGAASPYAARAAGVALEVPVRDDAGVGQCWTLNSSSWGKPTKGGEGFRVVWKGEGGATGGEGGLVEAVVPPLAPGMRYAFRTRLECRCGVAVSAATVYQTELVAPVSPEGLRACLTTHESRAGNTSKCVRLLWDPFHPRHGKNVVTSFTVQARRPRKHAGDQPPRGINHPHPPPTLGHSWQEVCSCPEIGCLDPATLGVAHIVADYRVRAEGPGGKGPWCEPLRVDLRVPDDNDDAFGASCDWSSIGGGGGDTSGGVSSVTFAARESAGNNERQPMGFVRPGARARDPLTGEVRRLWTKQRPLRVSPPPGVVATLVLPGASVTARTIAATEHKHRRAGGSKQLLWGALASPRAARGCRMEAASRSTALVPGSFGACSSNNGEEGYSAGTSVGGDTRRNRQRTKPVDEAGACIDAKVAPVPREVELMLCDELDISCCFGYHAASASGGGMSEGGIRDDVRVDRSGGDSTASVAVEGLIEGHPQYPVVPWINPEPLPHLQQRGLQIQRHEQLGRPDRDHRCRRRCRLRRRQNTAAAADHGVRTTTPATGELFEEDLSALTPHQQRQRRRRWQHDANYSRKSPQRNPRHRRPECIVGGRGGRGPASKQPSAAATAGNLDCYRKPNG